MSSSVHPMAWKRYLIICERLGYQPEPEAAVETNLLQQYKTLYARYCQDKHLLFNPSTSLDYDIDIQKLSERLYLALCEELGYESIIQIRRTIFMLTEQVGLQLISDENCLYYLVGSQAEGFRITTSDTDQMYVMKDIVIVNNTTEITALSCAKSNKTFITMETQHTKPGYVRLILETDKSKTCEEISSSCHNYDGKLYIWSTKHKEYWRYPMRKMEEVHGPCTTINHGFTTEDFAHCLPCTSQPAAVQNWVMRCNRYKWPDSVVLKQCISLGCQLAPVGSKASPHEHLEWRISFILMERTLLKSLSHSQFMCYGFLKLYLKEILGSFEEINGLVSSYFMKTLLLWEIQTNSQHNVGPDCLLQVFLSCLQRLYTWVKAENCPNFFIPENNMFENRIYGENKQTLQNILELLSAEKFYGLYRCQSIDIPYVIFHVLAIENPSMDESLYVTVKDIETHTWLEISSFRSFYLFKMGSIEKLNKTLKTLELILTNDSLTDLEKKALTDLEKKALTDLEKKALTDLEKKAVQAWISKTIIYITAHDFKNIIAPNVSPDIELEKYNSCCNIFRTHDYTGSDAPLYLATLMYITRRYNSCLDVISDCIKRFDNECVSMMVVTVTLQLAELRLELEYAYQIKNSGLKRISLCIYPEFYVSMLSVLCHYYLGDVERAKIEFQRLREIRSEIMKMDDFHFEEISWQILGICAEIIGNYEEAYQSYVRAYKSTRMVLHANVPLLRVLCVIYKLLHK